MAKSDLVDLEVHLHHQTDKAWKVSLDGDDKNAKWVPKSQCQMEDSDDGGSKKLSLPEWLAQDKGLI